MIRTSLTAMPRRGTVYAAKLLVFSTVTLVVSLITSFIAFFVGQAAMSGSGVSASNLSRQRGPPRLSLLRLGRQPW